MKYPLSILILFSLPILYGQGIYSPGAGSTGTTAIHKDSSSIVSWASSCSIQRGYQQIDSVALGLATQGDSSDALGKANGTVVSLGDSGVAILTLSQSLFNGIGPDFAVFENAFSATFLELAYVEVSSDGVHYVRFPSHSTTQDSIQIGSFGALDPTHINNLAGKYQVNYGTPFDLDDLPFDSLLNKFSITHIKIIDVIGNITPKYAQLDTQGNAINDPWPTPFASSGFDLDAVGFIHVNGINSIEEKRAIVSVFPNPFHSSITIQIDEPIQEVKLISLSGKVIGLNPSKLIDLSFINSGVYFLKITTSKQSYVKKVVKK